MKKFQIIGLSALPFFVFSSISSAATLVRDERIVIEVPDLTPGTFRILVNEEDATAFAEQSANNVVLVNPYPERVEEFQVSLVDKLSGEQLYSEVFRIAKDSEYFDSIETAGSAQLDTSAINMGNPRPEPFDDFERNTSESNFRADYQVNAVRGNYSVDLELEAINRTNEDNTLRFEGPTTDISRFQVNNNYKFGEKTNVGLNFGDIQLSSLNGLVNQGMSSRGIALNLSTFSNRLNVEFGTLFGSDIVGTVHGPFGTDRNSFRHSVKADATVVQKEKFNWNIHASWVDMERPSDSNFGISETNEAEHNTVFGLGSTMRFFDNRATLDLAWAETEYFNPIDISQFEEDVEVYDPGVTKGDAWNANFSWLALSRMVKEKPLSLGIQLGAEQATPLYRSVHGGGTADRKQWNASVSASYGVLSGTLSTTQFRNNMDNLVSIHTLDQAIHNASLDINLEQFRQNSDDGGADAVDSDGLENQKPEKWPDSFRKLIPSSVGFNAQIEDMKTLNGEVIILAAVIDGFDFMNQTSRNIGTSLSWFGLNSNTTIGLNYSFLDIDQRERAAADRRDTNITFSHDVSVDDMSAGVRLGFTRTDDLDPTTRSATMLGDWGLNLSFRGPLHITFAGAVDFTQNDFDDRAGQDDRDGDSKRFSLSMNFGEFIKRRYNLSQTPSVTALWQNTQSLESSQFGEFEASSSSFTLNLGVAY